MADSFAYYNPYRGMYHNPAGGITGDLRGSDASGCDVYPVGQPTPRKLEERFADVNGWFTSDIQRDGSVDVSAKLQTAINNAYAQNGYKIGKNILAPGTYRCDSALSIPATMDLEAYGAILDFSHAPTTLNAVTLSLVTGAPLQSVTHSGIRGLQIYGPGRNNANFIGLVLGGVGKACFEKSIYDIVVSECGQGIKQAANTYNVKFYGGKVYRNGIGFKGAIAEVDLNTNELIEFHGMTVSECVTMGYQLWSSDYLIVGGSLDFNLVAGIDVSADVNLTLAGTHFEQDANQLAITNFAASGSPNVASYGCTYKVSNGSITTPVINADQIHLDISGGWININALTQGTFVQSRGVCDLSMGRIGQITGVTNILNNMFDITGGSGHKNIWVGGSSGRTIKNRAIQLTNNVPIEMRDNTNISRNVMYVDPSNVLQLGNSNTALALNLKQIIPNYYGYVAAGLGTNFGIYFRTAAGAPPGGESGIEKGSLVLNQSDGKAYVNTGTSVAAVWTAQA